MKSRVTFERLGRAVGCPLRQVPGASGNRPVTVISILSERSVMEVAIL